MFAGHCFANAPYKPKISRHPSPIHSPTPPSSPTPQLPPCSTKTPSSPCPSSPTWGFCGS
ncbi:MAG: hypothetical protein EA368_08855 [Leptolyngbya sp. DLM2.Bin27]|nr:MAG: hypothetical protein EA368_08855 [Leptolyngbya sp. DLM2.Bin27]